MSSRSPYPTGGGPVFQSELDAYIDEQFNDPNVKTLTTKIQRIS